MIKILPAVVLLLAPRQADDSISSTLDAASRGISGYNFRIEAKTVDDEAFLKRLTKDLLGVAPTAAELKSFADDPNSNRRAAKINQLVADGRFDDFWARRFTEVFFGDPEKMRLRLEWGPEIESGAVKAFERWLRDKIRNDAPWTEIVSQMLAARGTLDTEPAAAYVLSFNRGKGIAAEFPPAMARQFLGIRLACAECHDHPFDKWRVEDYYALSAFIVRQRARVRDGVIQVLYADEGDAMMPSLPARKTAQVNMSKGGTAAPNFLFGGTAGREEDRMTVLAKFMTQRANTQLPRALSNRVWGWLFGFGIVHPVDDFNLKSKALSPALQQALVKDLIDHNYSLKRLVRVICATNQYQMGTPEEAPDAASFRHLAARKFADFTEAPGKPPRVTLSFTVPQTWTRVVPRLGSYGARMVYRIPDKQDPSRHATLGVQEGKIEADLLSPNPGQFRKPQTRAIPVAGKSKVTLNEVTGLYTCKPESDGPLAYTILVAQVESAKGVAATFKLEGPPPVVASWIDEFLALLQTAGD